MRSKKPHRSISVETLEPGALFRTNLTNESSVAIDCITIDAFLGGETVDVIKMDIEGFEPYALEGMKETLSLSKDIVLFLELAPWHLRRAGVEPEDYLARLDKAALRVSLLMKNGDVFNRRLLN